MFLQHTGKAAAEPQKIIIIFILRASRPSILAWYWPTLISGQPLTKQNRSPYNHISFFLVELPSNFSLNSHLKVLLGSLSSRSTIHETVYASSSYLLAPLFVPVSVCGFYYIWHKVGFTIKLLTVFLHCNAEPILRFLLILEATGRTYTKGIWEQSDADNIYNKEEWNDRRLEEIT
jgi:hypothetical protein